MRYNKVDGLTDSFINSETGNTIYLIRVGQRHSNGMHTQFIIFDDDVSKKYRAVNTLCAREVFEMFELLVVGDFSLVEVHRSDETKNYLQSESDPSFKLYVSTLSWEDVTRLKNVLIKKLKFDCAAHVRWFEKNYEIGAMKKTNEVLDLVNSMKEFNGHVQGLQNELNKIDDETDKV